MVRIKNRYLLVQILYPAQPQAQAQAQAQAQKVQLSSSAPASADTPAAAHHRYLLALHAPTPDSIGAVHLLRLVRANLAQLFGDAGAGLAGAGLAVKYWSNATSTFVLRCRREVVRWVWAAVAFVHGVPAAPGSQGQAGRECVMRVVRVSGTMKKCQEELVRRARTLLGRVKGVEEVLASGGFEEEMRGAEQEQEQEQDRLDVVMGKGKGKVRATDEEDLGVAVGAGLDESDDDDDEDMDG